MQTREQIGLMELDSGRLLDEIQNSYQLSIGVDVNIKHLNTTPVGQEVTATTQFIGQEGLLYKFKVDAFDNEGKIG